MIKFVKDKWEKTKGYDLVMGVPLILWFANSIREVRPRLVMSGRAVLFGNADLVTGLQFLGLLATVFFCSFLIYMVMVRTVPVRKSKGLGPRVCAFLGTFLGVGIVHLPYVPLSAPWLALSNFLIFAGEIGSFVVLSSLGQAFSIMPEARRLVTSGPYAKVRHPLYVAEAVSITGTAIVFAQPWAALLALGAIGFQVARSYFEERVLIEAFPEYEAYRKRTWRFIPGVI